MRHLVLGPLVRDGFGPVFERWGRRLALEPLDLWFLGLRAATLTAGVLWWVVAQAHHAPHPAVLAAFLAFSVALYSLNALRPGHIAILYRVALVFDLGVVFVLVRTTGGFASELHLAFILLVALHAFYFGVATGLGAAAASAGLYGIAVNWPPPMPGFATRVAFFALVGLCMGVLAEQARRRRELFESQQEQLMRSDRFATVGELAAGLAHELRNPLAGIAGALHVLGNELEPGDERCTLIKDVQAQIGRMNQTLSRLLQHARPAKPERVEVDINALIEQSLQFVPRGSIEVVRRLGPSLPRVEVDPNLVHQVFLNILVNARQAMPHGGRLTVESRVHGSNSRRSVEVLISDSGIGIDPNDLNRIFQPFFTTKSQGTGLGLAIAARVIEQHAGRITVDSTVGEGTTFTVVLPASPVGVRPGE
jgi:signal transduction histidine kinase